MMTEIFCPHCGGQMKIDTAQRLQSMLSCPYCGRKSLMQKTDDNIQLRGILSGNYGGSDAFGGFESRSSERAVDETAAAAAARVAELFQARVPAQPAASPAPSPAYMPAQSAASSGNSAYAPAQNTAPSGNPAYAAPSPHAAPPAHPAPSAYASAPAYAAPSPFLAPPAYTAPPPTYAPATPAAAPAPTYPAHPNHSAYPAHLAAATPANPSGFAALAESEKLPAAADAAPAEPPLERLVRLANQALTNNQMLAFNSYARQAIDCNPLDPRMYVLRTRLLEEAHGFARATFLSPGWAEQTPRQRNWIMAQHFATLNAAVSCSSDLMHDTLASQTGSLIARQIREAFLERARLRLGRRPFRGHFRRADLRLSSLVVETCLSIDETIVPRICSRLVLAIREELARLDPGLARHLQRKGF